MSRHQPLIRFDHSRPLTEDELHQLAPSVFAQTAHSSRSERFRPIPTIDVVRRLASEGFHVVDASQSKARSDDRKPYTKHLLRLRRFDLKYSVGDTAFEIMLKNANDGSAAYDLLAALFRILCLNGMVADVGELDALRVTHKGDVTTKVIEGTYEVLKQSERALEAPKVWSHIHLDTHDRLDFAQAAHRLRFADKDGQIKTAIGSTQLLEARRSEDRGNDLWKTFNVVQENMIQGGLQAEGFDAANRRRRFTSRPIRGVDADVKLNRALFVLADRVAVRKGARPLVPQREAA